MNARTTLAPALGLALLVGAIAPMIAGSPTLVDTAIVIAIYGLIALSVGVTYGMTGLLSVAQASLAAVGAYVTAILSANFGWSPWLTAPLAILAPAAFAYPFARVVTRLSPLALAIATLMFGYAFDIAVREGGDLTGGYIGLSGIPTAPGVESPIAYYALAWGVVIVAVAGYTIIRQSHIGAALRTIRSDALRASADGIDVPHLRSVSMAIGGALAGAAGWLYAHHLTYLGPESLGPALSLSAILMAVVGGVRSVTGPLLGAALLTLVHKFIPGQEVLGIFYGSAMIICLLIAPEGLTGLLSRGWRRARHRSTPVAATSERQEINLPQHAAAAGDRP
ncbi:branched-chain amino acid ABC transporter permease [Variovorax sp. J22P168]|uniref:branched-chain amino acid ABC transporter permease n=1 Tax=Variovorax jilinensis TaxID=3053513 RepID=UPI0025780410|nr:branched-chain amino acid ABC transporter permease [Variovorax sp. J22P168]MDM0014917.1 branched-chain amino acid ABC transporter permease [Variovorax sp. J22P168]